MNKYKEFFRKHYILVLLIVIYAIFHHVWLTNLSYISYGDARSYELATQRELLLNAFTIYNSSTNLGSIELSGGTKLIELVHGIFANFGLDYGVSFRFLYLYPIIFLAPTAIYFYSRKFLKSRIGVFIAGIVYLFNTYTLILQTAGVLMLVSNIFAIFALLYIHKYIHERSNPINFIPAILFGFLSSVYDFRIFYILAGISGLYFLHSILVLRKSIKFFAAYIIFILIIFLLNSHWILTIFSLRQISDNALFSRRIFGSDYFDLSSALTLFHRFWTGGQPSSFVNQSIPFYMWLIPLVAVSGFYFEKSKSRYFFFILAIIGIFLTKQEDAPFGFIYKLLYNNFPGFNAFREASKFYFITAISYSILIGYFVDYIYSHKFIKNIHKAIVVTAIFLIFIINGVPLINGSIKTLFVPRNIPQDYVVFNQWLDTTPNGYRTLWVPINSKWGLYTNQRPAISLVYIDSAFKDLKKSESYISYPAPKNAIGNILRQDFSEELINNLSINYIVVPLADKKNEDNFFNDYGKDPNYYYQLLRTLPYLREIDIGTNEIKVFENHSSHRGKLSFEDQKIDLEYKFISPFLYEVRFPLEVLSEREINFVFSEELNPNWRLYKAPNKLNISNGCLNIECVVSLYSLVEVESSSVEYLPGINQLSVSPNNITPESRYFLFYAPQLTYFSGLFVTILTTITLLIIYFFYLIRQKKHA